MDPQKLYLLHSLEHLKEYHFVDDEGDYFESLDHYKLWDDDEDDGQITFLETNLAGTLFSKEEFEYEFINLEYCGWMIEKVVTIKDDPEYFL